MMVNLLDSSHFFTLIRSAFISISTWAAISPATEIVVSSAYKLETLNRGPSIEPCGTPHLIVQEFDCLPSI